MIIIVSYVHNINVNINTGIHDYVRMKLFKYIQNSCCSEPVAYNLRMIYHIRIEFHYPLSAEWLHQSHRKFDGH